jgi:hypothetical protein
MTKTKPVRVISDENYPGMCRLQWRGGVLSADMYNRTRAKDILRNYDRYLQYMATAERQRRVGPLIRLKRSVVSGTGVGR